MRNVQGLGLQGMSGAVGPALAALRVKPLREVEQSVLSVKSRRPGFASKFLVHTIHDQIRPTSDEYRMKKTCRLQNSRNQHPRKAEPGKYEALSERESVANWLAQSKGT